MLSCLFGGRQKVQVTKFAFDDFIFVVGSAANSVGTTLEFAVFRSGSDPNDSKASAFCFFLSTTMVFAAVRTNFSRKTSPCLVDRTAINKQQFKYNNEHNFIRGGRLVDWLEFFPTIRAAGDKSVREESFFFSFFFFSFLSFFLEITIKNTAKALLAISLVSNHFSKIPRWSLTTASTVNKFQQ